MLYTGACGMRYGGFGGFPKWIYCSGGGYVLSYDLVTEVLNLPPVVHRVQFKPEDGYTGWLVYNVNKITNFTVGPESLHGALNMGKEGRDCGPFTSCFYHKMRTPVEMKHTWGLARMNFTKPDACNLEDY